MIDVLKRLAELDAKNPQVVKENNQPVEECGPMGMMGGMSTPHTPASINMTADSGSELTGMLRDIMQLAGVHQVGADDMGHDHPPAVLSAEPVVSVGPVAADPLGGADDMRAVLDKLNPEPKGDDELGPFQGDDDKGEEPEQDDDEDREETDETVDSMPDDPTNPPPADSNEYAHQENQPGTGNTSNGEKRQSNLPTATYESLMQEWKKFLGESEDDVEEAKDEEELDEGTCSACHKDPCECSPKDEATAESLDILKLAGLK